VALEEDPDFFNHVIKKMEVPPIPQPSLNLGLSTIAIDMELENEVATQNLISMPSNPYLAQRRLKKLTLE